MRSSLRPSAFCLSARPPGRTKEPQRFLDMGPSAGGGGDRSRWPPQSSPQSSSFPASSGPWIPSLVTRRLTHCPVCTRCGLSLSPGLLSWEDRGWGLGRSSARVARFSQAPPLPHRREQRGGGGWGVLSREGLWRGRRQEEKSKGGMVMRTWQWQWRGHQPIQPLVRCEAPGGWELGAGPQGTGQSLPGPAPVPSEG